MRPDHSIVTIAATLLAISATSTAAQVTNHPGDVNIAGNLTVFVSNGAGDLYVEDDSILDGSVCMGNTCVATETFANDEILRLKYVANSIEFIDTSGSTHPGQDWSLRANDDIALAGGGLNRFAIDDDTAGTTPFSIQGSAPSNALWIASDGDIGMGTQMPQADLQITESDLVKLRFDVTGSAPINWELSASDYGFLIAYDNYTVSPFVVRNGAPSASMVVDAAGNVGLGTYSPQEKLHIRASAANTDAFALFDAAGPGSDAAFLLRQNGTVPTTWEFRNQQGSGRLNVGIAGGNTPFKIDDAADNNLLRLGLNGQTDVVSVTGRLLVNSTQLNVPDYVFEADYALKPLSEVQTFIDANGHLPGVPSAAEVAERGLDMTHMQMVQLEKIEELTLHSIAQEARIAQLETLIANLLRNR